MYIDVWKGDRFHRVKTAIFVAAGSASLWLPRLKKTLALGSGNSLLMPPWQRLFNLQGIFHICHWNHRRKEADGLVSVLQALKCLCVWREVFTQTCLDHLRPQIPLECQRRVRVLPFHLLAKGQDFDGEVQRGNVVILSDRSLLVPRSLHRPMPH